MRANLIKLIPAALLLLGIAQSARAQAYLGVGGGTSFGQATFRSITEHQVHWGGQGSLFAGYRLGRLVSLEQFIMDMTFRNHGHNIRPVTD